MQETPYSFFITYNILEQIASFHFFTLKIIILAEHLRVIYLIKACWCQGKERVPVETLSLGRSKLEIRSEVWGEKHGR